jgi:hypothetical protein
VAGIAGIAIREQAPFRFICEQLEHYFYIDMPEWLTSPMLNSHCGEICTLLEAVKQVHRKLKKGSAEKKESATFCRRALARIKELCVNPQ